MNQKTFEKKLDQAMRRVAAMDEVDGYKDRDLGTIYAALECGIKNPNSGAHYDALVMLKDLWIKQIKAIRRN